MNLLKFLRTRREPREYSIQKRYGGRGWKYADIIEEDVPYMEPEELREYIMENYDEDERDGIYRLVYRENGRYKCAWKHKSSITIGIPVNTNAIEVFGVKVPIRGLEDIKRLKDLDLLDMVKEQNSIEYKLLELFKQMAANEIQNNVTIQPAQNLRMEKPHDGTPTQAYTDIMEEVSIEEANEKISEGILKLKQTNPQIYKSIVSTIQKIEGGR